MDDGWWWGAGGNLNEETSEIRDSRRHLFPWIRKEACNALDTTLIVLTIHHEFARGYKE